MITPKNIDYTIKLLKLIRSSTALIELINSKDFSENLNNIIGTELSIENKSNVSEAKMYLLSNLIKNGFDNLDDKNLSKEIAIDFVLDKIYCILKEYSEKDFSEDINE